MFQRPSRATVNLSLILILALLLSSSVSAVFAQDGSGEENAGGKVFLPFVSSNGNTSEQTETSPIMTNRMIVSFLPTTNAASVDRVAQVDALSAAAGIDLAFVREMSGEAIVVQLPGWMENRAVAAIAESVLDVDGVDYAEPDALMQTLATPNDPRYPEQWHYFAPVAGSYGVNLPAAWDITTGATSIVVAVIDTGILFNHADLVGRTVPGYDFVSDLAVANDGNLRDNNASDPGDWVTATEAASGTFLGCQVRNSSWHGSHVAGTIAGASNNGIGVAGINWQSKILPVRVLGKCGGFTSDIVDGIRWSAGLAVSGVPANPNPARVINMSLGGSGACGTTYQSAINAVIAAGTVVAVAAGNSNANAANYQPASCAGVITVASTNRNGSRASYSNFGTSVEIAAPGGETASGSVNGVLSTLNTGTTVPTADDYRFYQGTSMATPHVAGIVSLMLSVNPALTPAQVITLLQGSITPFPAGSSCTTTTCGTGIINAAGAVIAAQNGGGPTLPAAFAKTSPSNGATRIRRPVTLRWAVSSGAASYVYCIDTTNENACAGSWVSAGTATQVTLSTLSAATNYYWQVRATNTAGTTDANSGVWWSFRTR